MIFKKAIVYANLLLLFTVIGTQAIRCYQCSSDTDPKGEDLCGAYGKFDKEKNIAIECNSEESHMPGTFCVKITHQSPRGFICKFTSLKFLVTEQDLTYVNKFKYTVHLHLRDGRWRQVIRRCSSVASTGVTGVCNWGVYENGVYWEECSCSENNCNTASSLSSFPIIILLSLAISITIFSLR
ncbi:hypothetical protein E2986_10561 [Frieseomelitta varia]|uniref:Protein quiver n=1 Tax=Frieseomelitta varia TaxID=561572 RepID=A0A833RU88_9HYME|nr:hypothetical protein E2986_10561 [Frieseomelitta varia]